MTLFKDLDLALAKIPAVDGIRPADLLALPEIIGQTVGKMVRSQGLNLKEFALAIGLTETEAHHLLTILIAKGYVIEEEPEESQPVRYRANFAQMRPRHLPFDL